MPPHIAHRMFAVIAALSLAGGAAAKPLKIYILAGQSNMQGQAQLSTVPRMALSPETKALHDKMLDEAGNPIAHKGASIVYFTGGDISKGEERPLVVQKGVLAAGVVGAIGPDIAFGITMDEAEDAPILIIKTAWGGRSLSHHFRPPSAGLMPFTPPSNTNRQPTAEDLKKREDDYNKTQGLYYRLMLDLVKGVLADPGRYSDAYDPEQGYELAGFAWFQGYNDMIGGSGDLYKAQGGRPQYAAYTELLAHLIRDLRKDLNAPKMPAVIGVMGIGGESDPDEKMLAFRKAMAAVADLPEFKGNVAAVPTAAYWDEEVANASEKVKQANELWDKSGKWAAVGTPAPKDRVWNYTSFTMEDEKMYQQINRWERSFTKEVPAGMENWLSPDFDTAKWQKGPAPIGKGTMPNTSKKKGKEPVEPQQVARMGSPWGEGNMLLMKTSFHIHADDYSDYRLCVSSTRSFHVYLNGQLITSYPWWNDFAMRTYELDSKLVKSGTNELAFYGNIEEHKGAFFNSVDLYLQGLAKQDSAELKKQQDAIAPARISALAKGKSNQAFHYLGSAYTYSRVGEALAKAMIGLSKSSN